MKDLTFTRSVFQLFPTWIIDLKWSWEFEKYLTRVSWWTSTQKGLPTLVYLYKETINHNCTPLEIIFLHISLKKLSGKPNFVVVHTFNLLWMPLAGFDFVAARGRLGKNELHELCGIQFLFRFYSPNFFNFSAKFGSLNVQIRNRLKNVIFKVSKWCKININ